jgi:RHS repeat-associated protein
VSTTHTVYDAQGRVDYSVDRFGNKTYSVYDARGNVIETRTQAQDPAHLGSPGVPAVSGWMVARTLYDDKGRVEFSTDPYFLSAADYTAVNGAKLWLGTHTVYDDLGRTIATERYDNVQVDVVPDTGAGVPAGQKKTVLHAAYASGTKLSSSQTFYDNLGRVDHTLSETGTRTDYYYDLAGRQIAVLGPVVTIGATQERNLSESVFDPAGRLIQSRTNIAVTSANAHPDVAPGAAGRDDSKAQTTFYEYDPAGRQTAVISSEMDNPYTATAADGSYDKTHPRIHLRTESVYDDLGRRIASHEGIAQADPLHANTINRAHQRETTYEYDNAGNLTAVNQPVIKAVDFESDSGGLIPVRPRTEYTYDQYGNRLTITTNIYDDSHTKVYLVKRDRGYDELGVGLLPTDAPLDTDILDHFTTTTRFTYDFQNRQISRTLPLGVDAGDGSFTEHSYYADPPIDPTSGTAASSVGNGELAYSIDFEGRITAYLYDNTSQGGGRLVEKRFYSPGTISITSASTTDTIRTALATHSADEHFTYAYDEFGRTKTVTSFHGGANTDVVTNTYDSQGRLTRQHTTDGPELAGQSTVYSAVNYVYNRKTGQLVQTFTDSSSSTTTPGATVTDTRYTYDTLGRLVTVISFMRSGSTITGTTHSADWTNNIDQTINIAGDVTTYTYDLVGNLSRTKLQDGLVSDYTYDELNRLTKLVNYADTNTNNQMDSGERRGEYGYKLDLFGDRTEANEIDPNNKATTIDWVYDSLGRLTEERYDFDTATSSDIASDYVNDYVFDLVGNRVQKNIVKHRASFADPADPTYDEVFDSYYDRNDRLYDETDTQSGSLASTTTYEYGTGASLGSTAGNGTQETHRVVWSGSNVGISNQKLSETTSTYNLQGQLKQSVVDADGSEGAAAITYSYQYSDSGVRISQTTGTTKTIYVVDANNPTGFSQVLEEAVDTNNDGILQSTEVTKTYIIGLDMIAQATSAAAADAQYLMYDGHGSTRALLTSLAAVAQKMPGSINQLFAYDAYGNLLPLTGYAASVGDSLTSLLYSGEQTDKTGLQYLRARMYDPTNGRFTSSDPFDGNEQDPRSLHKYLYCQATPINGADPSGMFLEEFLDLLSFASFAEVAPSFEPPGAVQGRFSLVSIDVDSENMPAFFNAQKVQNEMQRIVNGANLPLLIRISVRQQNEEMHDGAHLRKYDAPRVGPLAISYVWGQNVYWDQGHHNARDHAAATVDRVYTTLWLDRFQDEIKDHHKNAERLFANVLMHEVFWLGILNKSDDRLATQTDLSSAFSDASKFTLQKDEIEAIKREIGPDEK